MSRLGRQPFFVFLPRKICSAALGAIYTMQNKPKKSVDAQGAETTSQMATLTVKVHPNLLSQAQLNCFVNWYTRGADARKAMNSLLELFFQNVTNETHFPVLNESEIFEVYMLYRFYTG